MGSFILGNNLRWKNRLGIFMLTWLLFFTGCQTTDSELKEATVVENTVAAPTSSALPPKISTATQTPIASPTPEPSKTATTSAPATFTAVPTPTPILPPITIAADDPNIRYGGRVDQRDPANPIFDWSGVSIETNFSGTSVAIILESGNNLFNVTIDGKTQVLQTVPEETIYQLAENLPTGEHHVRIFKRTEAQVGRGAFRGFIIDGGNKLSPAPAPPTRRIEFIGDSITVGYGNEGDSPTCYFTPATQNAARSFAGLTADHFEAEYSLIALSGLGVVRNFAYAEASSGTTAVDYFKRTVALFPGLNWDFTQWTPDVVVVNLGTNDFSTDPFPAQEEFVSGYTNLLTEIRAAYPQAHIFATAGPIMFADVWWYVETAVARANQQLNDDRIYYVPIENNLELSEVDYGCDYHPNVNGHQKMADQLIPAIAEIMGW